MRSDVRSGTGSATLLALALSCVALAGCESTDEPVEGAADPAALEAPPDPQAMQEQMALMRELQSIDQALTPIRQEAMTAPELQAQEQALVARMETAIEEAHPELVGAEARFDSLRSAYESARTEGDSAAIQSIATELNGLGQAMKAAQGDALQQEEIADAVDEFRETLFARMRDMDPRADSLLDLAAEIEAKLEEAMGDGETDG